MTSALNKVNNPCPIGLNGDPVSWFMVSLSNCNGNTKIHSRKWKSPLRSILKTLTGLPDI